MKRFFSLISVLLVLCLLFSGCGDSSEGGISAVLSDSTSQFVVSDSESEGLTVNKAHSESSENTAESKESEASQTESTAKTTTEKKTAETTEKTTVSKPETTTKKAPEKTTAATTEPTTKATTAKATTARTTTKAPVDENGQGQMVWIPNSGSKYHSTASCSNMKNPSHVSLSSAISMGYTACKKCW